MKVSRRLVLASRSPRRIKLLNQIGLTPEVIPPDTPEDFDPSLTPEENATALALRKAREVSTTVQDAIVIGADTIVVIDDMMLAKPEDTQDAIRMLRLLSGKTHTVCTGFALVERPTNKYVTGVESTRVTFRDLPDDEITEYVAGGGPLDKAGAYGIQDDYGAVFVSRVEGCFYNVIGFPLSRFHTVLEEFQLQLNHE